MKQTLFYLVCLLTIAALLGGCAGLPAPKPATASSTATTVVAKTGGPTPSATISTPAVVTVGAPVTASPTPTITPKPSKTPQPTATPKYAPVVKVANFVKKVDNPYFPLVPGVTALFTGTSDKNTLIEQISVTKRTRKILNVTCIEVDTALTINDKISENVINWYAQDKDGSVWLFGASVKKYNTSGKVASTDGTWLAGSKGALPGIIMQANPGDNLNYRQDYYKGHAEDMAQVLSLNETVTGTSGSYTNVLEIKEWSPLTPNVVLNKWYAKNVGLISVKQAQGGTLELNLTETK
jgi:hypothetical protein